MRNVSEAYLRPNLYVVFSQKQFMTYSDYDYSKKSGSFTDLFWLIYPNNLIGWENFCLYLRNKNFPKYGICAGTEQIILTFIIEQTQ